MKTRYILTVITSLLVLLSGCQTEIDLNLKDEDQEIVVNGIISPYKPVEVFVTWSLPLNGKPDDFRVINDAIVELWEDNQFLVLLQYQEDSFSYINAQVVPKAGSCYELKVVSDPYDPVIVSTCLPYPVPVDTISAWKKLDVHGDEIVTFDISFSDVKDEKNFYLVQLSAGDRIFGLYAVNMYQDEFMNFAGENNFDGVPLSDKGYDGQTMGTRCYFYYDNDYHGSAVQVRLVSLSEDLYRYLMSYHKHRLSLSEPYIEPVALYSSAINGIGLLGGFTYTTWELNLAGK